MKTALFLSVTLILVGIFSWFWLNDFTSALVSPILKTRKTLSLNLWFPKVLGSASSATSGVTAYATPEVTAKSALFVDTKTGVVLYEKNSHQRLPIASLVKVMTIVVAMEHRNLNEKLSVSREAAEMEPDKMLLMVGEELTLKELLYGIFLVSANDGAEVLAKDSTGNREEFLKLMNDKAKQLDMADSFFANPTGLDEDSGNSYSSAFDLAILTRYAIRNYPEIVDISSTYHMFIPKTSDHQDYDLYSGINLLTTYPGVVGFKTGFTPEAGLTLITLARKDGHEIVGVLLGSQDRRDEARELLDYSFKKLQ